MAAQAGSTPADSPVLVIRNADGDEIARGSLNDMGPRFVALGGTGAGYTMTAVEESRAVAAPAPAPVVSAVPTAAPAPRVSKSWDSIEVDADKSEKIREQSRKIEALGFALPQTWFAPGTRMLQIGVDTYKREYERWEARPPAVDALLATAQRIREEDRRSFVVNLGDLRMANDGTIGRQGHVSRPIEWGAWDQIYRACAGAGAFPDGKRLLKVLAPALRARIFNERVSKLDKKVKIGVRRHRTSGGWSIFRVVGSRFPEDGNGAEACEAAAQALQGLDFRGHVEYDPNTTDLRFDAAHMVDPVVLDPTVGDVFRGGIKGKTNDAGGGAFTVQPFVGRIICINCTMMNGYAEGVRKAHRGSMEAAIDGIREAAAMAEQVVPLFAEDWAVLRDTYIEDIDWHENLGRLSLDTRNVLITDPNAENVIRALVESKKIDAKIGRDALVTAMLASFKEEPGDTVADVINAITRTAHSKVPVLVGEKLEEDAGKLMAAIPLW